MHEKVVADLKAVSGKAVSEGKSLKPLKPPHPVKREPLALQDEPQAKRVKEEEKSDDEAVVGVACVEETLEEQTGLAVEAEAMMDKATLMSYHRMRPLDKGADGKKFPVFCDCCGISVEAKGRAKIWQHVRGQEHRRKRADYEQLQKKAKEEKDVKVKVEPADTQTTSMHLDKCGGLRLGSDLGKTTRLGGDLRELWDLYSNFTDFADPPAHFPQQHIHKITKL